MKRMSEKISLSFNYEIKEIEPLNSSFSKAKIAIAYVGENRNKSYIDKEVFEKALPTIKNIPIVAYYNEEKQDFEEHSMEIVEEDDEIKIYPKTIPVGVVAESCKQWWENVIETDGTEHEYLFTEAYLWQRQKEFVCVKRKKKCSLSMEINIKSYTKQEDGLCNIHNMEFECLCLLGDDIEPCFEQACIQLCDESQSEFKLQFSQMLQELKKIETEKGCETMDKEIFEKTFSLSHEDIRANLYKIMSESFSKEDIYIISVYDNYFIYEEWFNEDCSSKFFKRAYSKTEENVIIEDAETEVFSTFVTAEELADIENAKNKEAATYAEMKENYSQLETEVVELREFKAATELEQLNSEKNNILLKWNDLIGSTEEYSILKENIEEYSIEDIETRCKCIFADTKANFSKTKEKDNGMVRVPVSDNNEVQKDYYGGLIEKFRN